MYCIINYYDSTLDIGDTLKYLLVGSDEITLETVEVHVRDSLHSNFLFSSFIFLMSF